MSAQDVAARALPAAQDRSDDERRERAARRRARARTLGLRLVALAVLLGAWWLVAALEVWPRVLVPSPGDVLDAFVTVSGLAPDASGRTGFSGHLLHEHLGTSLRRIVVGSGIGTVLGVVLGLLVATVGPVRTVLEPAVTFLRQLPPLAYFSLLVIWFGIEETPKIWLLLVAAMPPVAVATAAAVGGVHRDYVNGARSLGAGRWDVARWVVLPAALPEILVGIRLGVGVAYTSVVAAETVNGVPGIGGMIRDAQRYLQTDVVVLGILVLGVSGLLLDACLRAVERRAGPWRGRA
ncbi:ABC transporter permease subunit [Cellulomonas sp. Sa3CUA2]|uniref:ABC transporter permease subunit n=1 Tax=Cellulomonas avistercoris TaxID=2762242 RepID=A0ABR8QE42_9CELL|nr:ABC transporter permease subunit [Cellulomonas avistercoris]MBD7918688.1 ABC transporter permease subunit [Cellulomonas avistercoris]